MKDQDRALSIGGRALGRTVWHLDKKPGADGWRHIWPEPDLREHELSGTECWCEPQIDDVHMLVTHNRVQ